MGALDDADLPPPERLYADTLRALADSLRSPDEMAEAASVLNPLLDARAATEDPTRRSRLDEIAASAFKAAVGARDARSGMAVEICLDYLRLALDDGREALRLS